MGDQGSKEAKTGVKLTASFHSSDEGRSFGLSDASGQSACLVFMGGQSSQAALDWLRSFVRERFERALADSQASGQKGSIVAFFQSVHADLFKEKVRWPEDLSQISLIAAHIHEHTIEIASVGSCAAYRLAVPSVERVIPSEANGAEISYLGAALKVSVEMVKRSLAPGVNYLLTSRRIDSSNNWASNIAEAVKLAHVDMGSAASMVLGSGGGALTFLEMSETPGEEEGAEARAPFTDSRWYRRLREDMAGAFRGEGAKSEGVPKAGQAEPEAIRDAGPAEAGPDLGTVPAEAGAIEEKVISPARASLRQRIASSRVLKRASVAALCLVLAVAIYAFWQSGGSRSIHGVFRGARIAGKAPATENPLRSALSLSSIPPGAEIVLDDSLITARTPVSTLPIQPGTHRVAMRLGELGQWSGDVSAKAGDTTSVRVAFVGEIAVSSGSQKGLSVVLDGALKGYTPCVLESVPAGLHVVKIEGQGFSGWEEEVLVTQGGIADVQAVAGKLPQTGIVRVTAGQVSEEGYQEAGNRAVYIDGRRAGVTPLKMDVKPGFHSIRVAGTKDEAPSVTVIQVRPGGKHFIRAEFTGIEPILVTCELTRAPSGGQEIVYASLTANADAQISKVELYLEKLESNRAGWETMAMLPGSHSVYAAAVPEGLTSGGGQIKYFVRVRTSEGIEYFSDVALFTARQK